jgi:5-methylcytosine-specific restriction protein A
MPNDRPSSEREWDVEPGEHLTRRERQARFGGALYGGIQPSNTTPNVFVYSDPAAGGLIYPYDGWSGGVFLYTGEGRLGDQQVKGGNKALLEHEAAGRAVRLFVADGVVASTSEKNHLYVGQFRVDRYQVGVEPAPDDAGEERSVLVFRLIPVGDVIVRSEDASGTGGPGTSAEANLVPPEQHLAHTYEVSGTASTHAERRESDLVKRFEAHLKAQGHEVMRWRLRPPGEMLSLLTDTYDKTARELFEAKGSSSRNYVRLAIGQLLDYRRFIDVDGIKLSVLLPSRPSPDVLALLTSVNMECVYEDGSAFRRVPAGTEGP